MNFAFDFDSTIITIESLDFVLSKISNGKFDREIEEITNLGMNGKIDLRESITRRLNICGITKQNLESFAGEMVKYITKGMTDVIQTLQERGHGVYIISGGLIDLILPVAQKLGVPKENCRANSILFNHDGYLVELDSLSPLLYKNGKSKALEQFGILGGNTVMIGDGFTDLEVHLHNPVVKFIGFGVNVVRPIVQEKSPAFVTSMNDFIERIEEITM